jgi:hypothetical protein
MVDWQMVWIGIILISDTNSTGSTTWVHSLARDPHGNLKLIASWQTAHSRNKA